MEALSRETDEARAISPSQYRNPKNRKLYTSIGAYANSGAKGTQGQAPTGANGPAQAIAGNSKIVS